MSPAPTVDRRLHSRHPLASGVQFHHAPSQGSYPGRCANISKGGMMMYVPATAPVQAGDPVRVTLGGVRSPEFAFLGGRPLDASIVRVNRRTLLEYGHIAVALRFLDA